MRKGWRQIKNDGVVVAVVDEARMIGATIITGPPRGPHMSIKIYVDQMEPIISTDAELIEQLFGTALFLESRRKAAENQP